MKNLSFIISLFFLLISSNVLCQQPHLEKIKIASGGHLVHFMPFDLAVAKGFFIDEGLDPEIIFLQGGTATAQALLANQVDFSLNSIDHAFKAAIQRKDNLRMVVLLNKLPGMTLVVDSRLRNDIKDISDLKGKSLGVTSKGSATHMVLASLLSNANINPADVTIFDVGSSTFPPALKNQQIVGGIALEPFASTLVEQGKAFILADLNTLRDTERYLGGVYNQAGVLTRQDVIDNRPDLVQKVVNIHIRALSWIREHTPQEITDALPGKIVGSDKIRYAKTLDKLKEFYSLDGIINPKGVENVYHSMMTSGTLANKNTILNREKFFTNYFVEKSQSDSIIKKNISTNNNE
ncbi:ABC transporter substrate-binding protein [Nitrosomonas sp.]|uniref:ABC transporter substrate-binding protein n=1 Tax=Nitrosomonas sp. TaxID=42353 RepID=UPI0025F3CBE1|nr:ABC transporter substrate-binding protein [Nitrosomonas sp.]